MTTPRNASALRFAIHSKRLESGLMCVEYTAYRGDEVVDTTLIRKTPFRFRNPRHVMPSFMAALEGPTERAIPLSALPCPGMPVLFNTGHPDDMGHGLEAHYHQCPKCWDIFRHLRPIDHNGKGWGMAKAVKRLEDEGPDGAYLKVHSCPGCGFGPVFPWVRGPIDPILMDGNFFPMMCNLD